ncbi:MAG: 5-(carboxyamino)imidazole ribonucleotide mutase [candidate division WOR-3 bacterium]
MISIILGSRSDLPEMEEAEKVLKDFGVKYELQVISAHRNPEKLRAYIKEVEEKNFEVIIAAAGMAAHLPGVIASQTILPVIGVPMKSELLGLDSLLSIAQMPRGIPVATMGIGKAGAVNAVLFAMEILSLKYPEYKEKMRNYRERMRNE